MSEQLLEPIALHVSSVIGQGYVLRARLRKNEPFTDIRSNQLSGEWRRLYRAADAVAHELTNCNIELKTTKATYRCTIKSAADEHGRLCHILDITTNDLRPPHAFLTTVGLATCALLVGLGAGWWLNRALGHSPPNHQSIDIPLVHESSAICSATDTGSL